MKLLNPSNVSRFCPGLAENVEPYEERDVPDEFARCEHCSCMLIAEAAPEKPDAKAKA